MLGRVAQAGALGQEELIQGDRQGRVGRPGEAGPAALADGAVEGELTHHQHLTAHGLQPKIHFVVFIGKDPEAQQLLRQLGGVGLRVLRAHAQENQEAAPNLPVDFSVNGDGRGRNPCQNRSHDAASVFANSGPKYMPVRGRRFPVSVNLSAGFFTKQSLTIE